MSVQLREPLCSLGRRHISKKPWPLYLERRSNATTITQGSDSFTYSIPRPNRTWLAYARAYTTSAATVTVRPSIAVTEQVPVKSIHVTSAITPRLDAFKFWQQYQQRTKETMTSKELEHLMSTLLQQAQKSSRKSVFWSRIIQVYETAQQSQLQSTPSIYLTAMMAYGRTRNTKQIMAIFKEYKTRFRLKDNAYQRYFAAIIDSGDFSSALSVYRDIKSNPNLSVTEASVCLKDFVAALCSSNKKSNVYTAIKAVEEMRQSMADWDPSSRQQITESLWQGYHTLAASKAPPITPESAEHLLVMTRTTNTKIIPSQLFTLFQLLCHQSNGFAPTAKTCNWMLENQLLDKNYSNVKSVLAWMQKLDIEPTSSTVAILLRTFGTRLPAHQAEQLYAKSRHQKDLDAEFFKNYIQVFAKDSKLVKSVLQEGRQHGFEMDQTWHMAMTQSFVQRGQLDQGIRWLQHVNSTDLDCYASIMEAYLQRGQWNKCIAQYESLLHQQQHVDVHRRLVKCAVAAGFADKRSNMLDDIKIKFTPNTVMRIVNTLLCLESKHGQPLVSGGIVVKSLKMMESKLHVYLDAEGVRRVILGLGNRGDCQRGFAVYKYVREGGHDHVRKRCASSHIYLAMMASATKNNDIRILERAWVDMQYRKRFLEDSSRSKEPHNLARYNILLNGYASQLPRPNLTGVKRVFQKLLKQKLSPDTVTYNILIKAFVSANNMDAANQILKQLDKPDTRATNTLLNGWIIQQNWDQVEKFVKQQPVDMVTFNLLIQNFLKLDSKSMSYMHILKNKQQWHELDKLRSHKSKSSHMSSQTIWNIFESATGYTRHGITQRKQISMRHATNTSLCHQLERLQQPAVPSKADSAFIKLFSKSTPEAAAAPDQITYKLFMKAFVNIGDYQSASDVYQWMKYSLQL
ncbi:hypothetical protein MAM1_0015c01452 [Mucor ambiguus]|uniref:Pentacotripeptide-repeat region of PRORP domain-containing protein n=1 Tax=Mucor ambiguus TaxID=91626 RepID=A0A0C9MJE3_9FUNG|nr:hypothetical protein MAM1_0015c01452 [Mucor ambiguus]